MDASRVGRRPLLDSSDLTKVEALQRDPRPLGYTNNVWTLPRIAEVITTLTNVPHHPATTSGALWLSGSSDFRGLEHSLTST